MVNERNTVTEMTKAEPAPPGPAKKSAIWFVVLLGIVSLFSDMTYEGARSIAGPFLGALGAGGAIVGIVSGFGELVGYGLRLASGMLSDRTQRYWPVTIVGYLINLLAVPALALAGRWEVAAALIIAERAGKAIRTPARDVMLSHATTQVGRGWGFGLHEAMDQAGAIAGPLIVAAVIHARSDFRYAFVTLLIPALLAIGVLLAARFLYPRPEELETPAKYFQAKGLPRVFWLYLASISLVAAGYADFPLIAFHFQTSSSVSPEWIPVFYSVAMAADALSALMFGRFFDRWGLTVLAWASLASAWFAPLVFWGGFRTAMAGMVVWGVGMGAQESILRAAVAGMVRAEKRGTAYGIFNAVFGLVWFLGSAAMGVLYDRSVPALIAFSTVVQLGSVPALFLLSKRYRPGPGAGTGGAK